MFKRLSLGTWVSLPFFFSSDQSNQIFDYENEKKWVFLNCYETRDCNGHNYGFTTIYPCNVCGKPDREANYENKDEGNCILQ